ncbi:GNAT family N-acetyltransferase [Nocardia arthritidis]|uniref:GNAT family N-acetyltransferase n=1 Tax=Nocardia arthritidis TaxID=228602 RepID=A0A6G9YHB5_9NOCA|nr:GNAT family N-acetyltransferase [Nocardia arthritidis]QIS12540.1 GNAT family N-acetyltransferase [Nocardia arthritidis]
MHATVLPETAMHPAIRQLGPADAEAIRALHAAMDAEDGYFRFFMPPPKDLHKVAHAIALRDPEHCAVGAFLGGELVGVANFIVLPGTRSAEVALVVAAEDQQHGIGTALLRSLAELAREHGIERFVAEVLPANSRMMRLLIDGGFPVTTYRQNGVVQVGIQL